MQKNTRLKFNQLLGVIANTYGVEDTRQQFNVEPADAQNLQDAIVERSTFLQKINVLPVSEIKGQNILAGVHVPLAGRTQTTSDNPRKAKDALSLTAKNYQLFAVESDVAINFATLDAWAKFPDMFKRFQEYVNARIANDRELAGWYGESAADNTDIIANPELQDVNIGWLQYIRANHAPNILTEGGTTNEIRLGTGGDYSCLDEVISDLVSGIPVYLRSNLVAFIGDELISSEKRRLYAAFGEKPSEKNQLLSSLTNFGGVSSWETPSNFPGRGLVITSYDNLSLYHQDTSWKRRIEEEVKYNRMAIYNSRNEGYTIETPEKFVAIEFKNVKLPDGNGGWV